MVLRALGGAKVPGVHMWCLPSHLNSVLTTAICDLKEMRILNQVFMELFLLKIC